MHKPFVRTLLLPGLAIAAALSLPTVAAQQAPRPEFLTTPAQREALELAATRGLDYIPGDVIVKFRTGTTVAGQTRALDALRSRPVADRLQWIGDRTARLHVDGDLDSPAIAATLSRQPEVEYAHPNWLLKPKLVPNDTSYGSRQ